jgi:methyl-CpG-binding domain protein 4
MEVDDDGLGVQEEDVRQRDASTHRVKPQVIIYTPARPFAPALRRSSIPRDGSETGTRTPSLAQNSITQVRDKKGRFSSARKAVREAANTESKKRRRSSSMALDRIAFQAELEDQASTIFDEYVADIPPPAVSPLSRSPVPPVNRALFKASKAASDDGSLWEPPVPRRRRCTVSESGTLRMPQTSSIGRLISHDADNLAEPELESPMQLRSVKRKVLLMQDTQEPASEDEEFFDSQETAEQDDGNFGTSSKTPANAEPVVMKTPALPTPVTSAVVQSTNNIDLNTLHTNPPSSNPQAHAPNSSRRRISSLFSPPAKRMKRDKAADLFDKVEKPLVVRQAVVMSSQGQNDRDHSAKACPEIRSLPPHMDGQDVVQQLLDEVNEEINNPKVAKGKTKRPPTKSPFFKTPAVSPTKKGKPNPSKAGEEDSSVLPSTPRKSTTSSPSKRSPGGIVSCIPFPPLFSPTFGLIQEKLAHDPFRLIIAVAFLNRTRGKQAIPVFFSLMGKYPTPTALANASREEVVDIIRHLGLHNQRAATYQQYAKLWIEDPPMKGKRYAVKGYPEYKSGRDVKKGEVLDNEDAREAWEIGHMTQGPYAIDSWRIFCRDELRGLASDWNGKDANEVSSVHSAKPASETNNAGNSKPFQPEWMRVLPQDKELRAYLRWMWLKEGFEWDPFTGDKEVASEDLQKAANEGRIAWDDEGGMRVLSGEGEVVDEVGVRGAPQERTGRERAEKVRRTVEDAQEGDLGGEL